MRQIFLKLCKCHFTHDVPVLYLPPQGNPPAIVQISLKGGLFQSLPWRGAWSRCSLGVFLGFHSSSGFALDLVSFHLVAYGVKSFERLDTRAHHCLAFPQIFVLRFGSLQYNAPYIVIAAKLLGLLRTIVVVLNWLCSPVTDIHVKELDPRIHFSCWNVGFSSYFMQVLFFSSNPSLDPFLGCLSLLGPLVAPSIAF